MSVTVLYFAAIRELLGIDVEEVDPPPAVKTVGDFAAYLGVIHPALVDCLHYVRFARNEEFALRGEPIAPGDTFALIPPVAGG